MTQLDPKVAAELKHQAQYMATSRGIDLAEARQIVWADYQRQKSASVAPGPEPPPTARPAAAYAPRWNDTNPTPRSSSNQQKTPEQLAAGKQKVQQVFEAINGIHSRRAR